MPPSRVWDGLARVTGQVYNAASDILGQPVEFPANLGDGAISAFDVASGKFKGYLRDAADQPVFIDGVWGLTFGNGVSLRDLT